jgi:CRP-like cAMP-binding protein
VKPFPAGEQNLLLEAMPAEDRAELIGAAEVVQLARGEPVFRRDGQVPHIFFPMGGMISAVTRMQDGSTVECITIGKEGVTGPPLVAEGSVVSNVDGVCQLPGPAVRVPIETFFDLRRRSEAFDRMMSRHGLAVFAQIAQTAACNRLHPMEARTSRWLLQAHDRMGDDVMPLTQEFLAEMLGVRRETVNLSARLLQSAGLIRYRRGEITVLDRDGLESTSCECYAVMRADLERLLGLA